MTNQKHDNRPMYGCHSELKKNQPRLPCSFTNKLNDRACEGCKQQLKDQGNQQ